MGGTPDEPTNKSPALESKGGESGEYITLGNLPDSFRQKVQVEFAPYTIGLARVRDEEHKSFAPIGSGTFIKKGSRYGILTARHCTHECNPQLSFGTQGRDSLYLCLQRGITAILPPNILYESPTTIPESDEYGPDLTFIQILPGPQLDSLLAISSAWNMDRPVKKMLSEYSGDSVIICPVGYPEELCQTQLQNENCDIHRTVKHMTYINSLEDGDCTKRNGWDYIDIKMLYEDSNQLPNTFEGMSGGPVWALKMTRNKATKEIDILKPCLVGVVFYQTALGNNMRHLRAHFIRSIYDKMWKP